MKAIILAAGRGRMGNLTDEKPVPLGLWKTSYRHQLEALQKVGRRYCHCNWI